MTVGARSGRAVRVGGTEVTTTASMGALRAQPTPASEAFDQLVGLLDGLGGSGWRFRPADDVGGIDLRGDTEIERWPLVGPDWRVVGTVEHKNTAVGAVDVDDAVRTLLHVIGLLVTSERAAAVAAAHARQAQHDALVDGLTGLANRRGWDLRLVHEQARCDRQPAKAAIVVIDVDDLKQTNDCDGHLAGDIRLRLCADALRRHVRDSDLVARVGGDEFAVLALDWVGPTLSEVVDRLADGLSAAGVAASVGAAVHCAGRPLVATYNDADLQMYETKRRRRHRL